MTPPTLQLPCCHHHPTEHMPTNDAKRSLPDWIAAHIHLPNTAGVSLSPSLLSAVSHWNFIFLLLCYFQCFIMFCFGSFLFYFIFCSHRFWRSRRGPPISFHVHGRIRRAQRQATQSGTQRRSSELKSERILLSLTNVQEESPRFHAYWLTHYILAVYSTRATLMRP